MERSDCGGSGCSRSSEATRTSSERILMSDKARIPPVLLQKSRALFSEGLEEELKNTLVCSAWALSVLLAPGLAKASIIMTLEQSGSDVVLVGSGTADTSAISPVASASSPNGYIGSEGAELVTTRGGVDYYFVESGASDFGSGGYTNADSSSGDVFGPNGSLFIFLPTEYVSGTRLFGTATWSNTTLADLGVTTGTYTWTWASGTDSLTLYAGVDPPTGSPEPSSALLITGGLGLIGLCGGFKRCVTAEKN